MFEHLKQYKDGAVWDRFSNIYTTGPDIPSFKPQIVYHYTTVAGLQGIVESNKLWASAAYYLNDSSEIEYGCKLVLAALAEWQKANQGNVSFAVNVLNGLQSLFLHPDSRMVRSSSIYVACFCEDGNLLSQWRAYGAAGGYSLGFNVNALGRIALKGPGWAGPLRLAQVIYDEALQRRRLQSLLRQSLIALAEPPTPEESAAIDLDLLWREVVLYIQELLLDEIVTFKNPAFAEEREWRLVVRPSVIHISEVSALTPAPAAAPATQPSPFFKFRQFRGSLVPYIELSVDEGKLPLRSVRFGPTLQANRIEFPLRMLLAACQFRDVDVTGSELPVIL